MASSLDKYVYFVYIMLSVFCYLMYIWSYQIVMWVYRRCHQDISYILELVSVCCSPWYAMYVCLMYYLPHMLVELRSRWFLLGHLLQVFLLMPYLFYSDIDQEESEMGFTIETRTKSITTTYWFTYIQCDGARSVKVSPIQL